MIRLADFHARAAPNPSSLIGGATPKNPYCLSADMVHAQPKPPSDG